MYWLYVPIRTGGKPKYASIIKQENNFLKGVFQQIVYKNDKNGNDRNVSFDLVNKKGITTSHKNAKQY